MISLQSCLSGHSYCLYLLEVLLSRATVPKIPPSQTRRSFSCTRAPKIWSPNSNMSIPPLLLPYAPENHKHPPAPSPSYYALTQGWGVQKSPAVSVADKAKPCQTQLALPHQCGPSSTSRTENLFFFFLSGNWGDQSQRTAGREEKSCPQQGCQSLAICSESYISLLLMNKLISNTRNQRQLTGNTHLLLPLCHVCVPRPMPIKLHFACNAVGHNDNSSIRKQQKFSYHSFYTT